MFNDGQFWERVQAGELKAVLMEEGSARPEAQQPPGTRSQMISYRDSTDKEIARVHPDAYALFQLAAYSPYFTRVRNPTVSNSPL